MHHGLPPPAGDDRHRCLRSLSRSQAPPHETGRRRASLDESGTHDRSVLACRRNDRTPHHHRGPDDNIVATVHVQGPPDRHDAALRYRA